jgi:hypothetical protein
MKWVALGIVGGIPVAALIVGAVVAAMDGDRTGFLFIGSVLLSVVISRLVLDLALPGDTPTDDKPASAEKE